MDPEDPLFDDALDGLDIDYETPAEMPEDEPAALSRASWHLRMASMIKSEQIALNNLYQEEIDRLQIKQMHRWRIAEDRIAWHEAPVEEMHLKIIHDDPKRAKTLELPHGTSKVRVPVTPKVHFTDQEATLAWVLENHPEIVKHSVGIAAVRSIIDKGVHDKNGEIVPGIESRLDQPTWSSSYETKDQ